MDKNMTFYVGFGIGAFLLGMVVGSKAHDHIGGIPFIGGLLA
jgi:hypothetical protein